MAYILLGEPAFIKYSTELESLGFIPIPLPADRRLNNIVQSHADTLIFADRSTLIANKDYISVLPDEVVRHITAVSEFPFGVFPTDTAFNALTVGRYMFARIASLAPVVKEYADNADLTLVNTNQGYAKCSTLVLPSARAAITADAGMAKAMESVGITVLRICSGHIALDGCEYGFIGGASFVHEPLCCCSLSEHKRYVYFFGDIKRHPDGDKIVSFISRFKYEIICLNGELTDFGSAVIL